MKLLITGGAGYIGSHVLLALHQAGHDCVVFDNLSSGNAGAVGNCQLVVGDLADHSQLQAVFQDHAFDAVLHFAAYISVAESVAEPLKYYANNTRNTLNLLQACQDAGIDKFIFSSTAAVYGAAVDGTVSEDSPLAPINPYGASKQMSERILEDLAQACGLRYVCLRYFNVAGADPEGRIGEDHEPETHLIPLALQTITGRQSAFELFGDDYDTPDGTCIRDYIHVTDLARGHRDALDYLAAGGESCALNCGYGHGYSVLEVIESVERVTGQKLAVTQAARRPGAPPELVAVADRIKQRLGWQPQYDNLDDIVATAWRWECRRRAANR